MYPCRSKSERSFCSASAADERSYVRIRSSIESPIRKSSSIRMSSCSDSFVSNAQRLNGAVAHAVVVVGGVDWNTAADSGVAGRQEKKKST